MADYNGFLAALAADGFEGELTRRASDRLVLATDNSIYQVAPDAVAFPKGQQDLIRIARRLGDARFADIVLRPRGGGTGTNGQSLGDGLVVDCSRHMTGILEMNVAERWARVQPGLIKDALNREAAKHGLFFAPELSTSSRATLGGMISTDACGQGSCAYGKTSNHVLELTAVLPGGDVLHAAPRPREGLDALPGREGEILRGLDRIAVDQAALIAERFPKMNRTLTGYDLAHLHDAEGRLDPRAVICGAEGTLALIAEAKVNLLPIPTLAGQINIFYDDFQSALRDARVLAGMGATSVETVDSKVLGLARQDPIWLDVSEFFPDADAQGINLVEFSGHTAEEIAPKLARLKAELKSPINNRRGHTEAHGPAVERISAMRKKAVGLLGRTAGAQRPLPFVEDCAVPPENLEPFIAAFRAILDAEGLRYGMFGHVDAGVLHVRPALDLTDPAQETLIRRITEQVQALARQHGGLLWGEHGKGVRSEYVPEVFGPLYPSLQEIKRLFDPLNQLNPGKIAAPATLPNAPLMTIDGVPMRGQQDRQIPPDRREAFGGALTCNGNGACFAQDVGEAMCPSYKATGDRRHSPKGRAGLAREWLRQGGPDGRADPVFETEVKEAMDGCLSCRACARACPVQVDVPQFRSKFLDSFHSRHRRRPLADHALARLEALLPLAERIAPVANLMLIGPGRHLMHRLGLHHLPGLPAIRARAVLRAAGLKPLDLRALPDPATSVILVPDAFTRYFEPQLLTDFARVAHALGITPWLAPYRPSGKPLHVLGRQAAYHRAAHRQASLLRDLAEQGHSLVGLEPAVTLTYADEYAEATGASVPVDLPQTWLLRHLDRLPQVNAATDATYLPHCTEATLHPASGAEWARILGALGVRVARPRVGCCGMAGTWGHETRNETTSRTIWDLSWNSAVAAAEGTVLASGFSCRCQSAIRANVEARHPLSLMREILGATAS